MESVGGFFEGVLGLRRTYDHKMAGIWLRGLAVDDLSIELIEYPDDHPMRVRATGIARMHLGFTVADIDRAERNARSQGIEILVTTHATGPAKYCYLRGPEGIVVELVEYEGGLTRASQLI
jgi:catechol 2,3-dioxygenase-like lactoylglutathione lyase family enzyme